MVYLDCNMFCEPKISNTLTPECHSLEMDKIHHLDCIEGMKTLESESVDIIIADPPYNIGKDFGVKKGKK